jgi:hypothetical protein
MALNRRLNGFLRRLAVCVEEKHHHIEAGTAALLSDFRSDQGVISLEARSKLSV